MKARDIMCREVVKVPRTMGVWELARLLDVYGFTGVPVVDEDGSIAGVVSQTDIVRHLKEIAQACGELSDFYSTSEDGAAYLGVSAVTAADLMNAEVIHAPEETPIHDLSRMMLKRGIHRILITRAGKLCGIVTTMDLLKAL